MKKVLAVLLTMIMMLGMISPAFAAEGVLATLSLSGNTSFYSGTVPAGTKLKVSGFDAEGNSVDLSDATITYESTRPWVLKVDKNGTIVDGGYDGTTIVTAKVGDVSGSLVFIKASANGKNTTRGFETNLTVDNQNSDAYPYQTWMDPGSTAHEDGGHDGNGYLEITSGKSAVLQYRGSWDNAANIRVGQTWFYDDGTSAVDTLLQFCQVNPRAVYYDKYVVGGENTPKAGSYSYTNAWAALGLDESIHASVIKDTENGFYYYGAVGAVGNGENYYYTSSKKDSGVERTKGWHQATAILDEDGTMNTYIDGVLVGSEKCSKSNGAGGSLRVGTLSVGKVDDIVLAQNPNTEKPEGYIGEVLPLVDVTLSENKSYYSSDVPADTKLKVTGIDEEGKQRPLVDEVATFTSTRPWVFDIAADGTIIDGGYEGSTIVTATVGDYSASLIMIKGADNGYNSTEGMGERSVFKGKSGYLWRTYKSADYANVDDKISGGHDGGDYFVKKADAGTNGDKAVAVRYARGSWDVEGKIRIAQGWFYDDLTAPLSMAFNAPQLDPNDGQDRSNLPGIDVWKNLGIDKELAAAAGCNKNGYYWNGKLIADADDQYYTTAVFGVESESAVERTKGWHQTTMIVENDGTVTLYLDGESIATGKMKAGNQDSQFAIYGYHIGQYDDFILTQNLNTTRPEDYVVRPMAPVASGVKILGMAEIGRTLTADALITDMNEEDEVSAGYQWEVLENGEWKAINGATAKTYKVVEGDKGKQLRVTVTPVSNNDPKTGKPVSSEPTSAVTEQIAPSATGATINGTVELGETVKATFTYVPAAGGADKGECVYIFEAATEKAGPYNAVQNSTSDSYTIKTKDLGKFLRVRVIPKDVNGVAGEESISDAQQVSGNLEFFVSTYGDDSNEGSINAPFATIEKARDAIRALGGNLPKGGVVVNIRGGIYEIDHSIEFTNADSGTKDSPIVYQAYNNEKVSFIGGKELDTDKVTPVTDTKLLNRLSDQNVRDHLMQLDLRAQGIEMSPVDGNGWYDFPVDAPNEIFMNGARLTKARWPNDDESQMLLFAKPATKASHGVDTTKYNGGNMPLMMIYPDAENRTNNWEFKKNDLLIGGAIAFAWAASELRVDELNTKEKWFTTSDKHVYGIDPEIVGWGPQYKIYFANVFEEIDKPGESYVDREKGILYFYPVGKVEGSEMVVSTLEKEMLKITNASHITFKGIEFNYSRSTLAHIYASNNIQILDGSLSGSAAQNGIMIHTSSDIKIAGNHIYSIAGDVIQVTGCGDRLNVATKPANVVIENNNIHSYSYNYGGSAGKQGIFINNSAGVTIRNNEISDFPCEAVMTQGSNDVVIEYNKIHHGSLFATDNGAIYWGRDASSYGNVIRYNLFEEIGSVHVNRYLQMGTAGSLFVDDGGTGAEVYGNIFVDGGIGCSLTEWKSGGYGTLSWSTNTGIFFNCYNNIIVRTSDDWSPTWGSLTSWHKSEEYTYQEDGKKIAVDPITSVNTWAKLMGMYSLIRSGVSDTALTEANQRLLFSDEWKEHYKGTNWERATNFYTKERYEKGLEFYNAKDANGFLKWVDETFAKERTNLVHNNVVIGVDKQEHGPYSDGAYLVSHPVDAKNTYFADLDAGAKLFEDFDGKDYTLTDEGLAKIKTVATEFEEIDFDQIGLYKNSSGKIPGGSAPSVTIKNSVINGIAMPGNTISPAYTFVDEDGDAEGNSKVYWYVADTADGKYEMIRDQARSNFVIGEELSGRYLKYEIIPYDQYSLRGNKVTSEPIAVRKSGSVNTAAISAAIAEANQLLDNAVIGTEAGQYPEEAVVALQKAVDDANAIAVDPNAIQYQINQATESLEAAILIFKSKQNNVTDSYDVTFDRITVNELLKDEENWTNVTGAHKFENGSLLIGEGVHSWTTYQGKKFKNTEFTFRYKAEAIDESKIEKCWGGIYLRQSKADSILWTNGAAGSMIDMKPSKFMLQEYPVIGTYYESETDFNLELGKEYLMTAGIYDLDNEEKVLLVFTVDGKTVYANVLESNALYGAEGYLGFNAGDNTLVTISPVKADTENLDAKIADAERFMETISAGEGYNQYPVELKEALEAALEAAEKAAESGIQSEVDKALAALNEALVNAKQSLSETGAIKENDTVAINYELPTADLTVDKAVTDVTMTVDPEQGTPEINVDAEGVTMEIQADTLISDDFKLPLAGSTPSADFTIGEADKVYGAGNEGVTTDKPVRIVLKNANGMAVAYKNEKGSYSAILKNIKEDTFEAAESALAGAKVPFVKVKSGNDIVIYTTMLAELVTYNVTQTNSPTPTPTSQPTTKPNVNIGGGGGGIAGVIGSQNKDEEQVKKVFTDTIGHWAEADINEMADKGIVSGVSDTTFEPDRSITRAEFAALMTRALKLTAANDDAVFTDVSSDSWYKDAVSAAAAAGLIVGYDGQFRPNDTITREEMAVVIMKAYQFLGNAPLKGKLSQFADKDAISRWAVDYVDGAVSSGLISGMDDGTFAPKANATRAQVASLIKRLLNS